MFDIVSGTASAKAKAPSTGISVQSGKSYEQEFASEIGRALVRTLFAFLH